MAFAFTLGTWNILASAYIRRSFYPNTPQSMLEARSRVPALVRRAIELQLDILCLQEVEPAVFAPLQEGLVANGYQGTMALKGGGKPDGCAIFFRTSCFNLLNERRVEYQDGASRGPNSGHIAQRMTLDIGGVRLALVNTHLKWDPPETPTEQQWGYRQASEALRLVTEEAADVQAICGDFNATPDADAVELLIESGFDYTHRNCAQTFTCNSNRMPKLIDYIAFRGSVRAEPLQVPAIDGHTPLPSEEQPSDHLPLTAKLILALYYRVLDNENYLAHYEAMVKRLFAIAFIFLCTSVAWLILGGTLVARSGASADRLRGRVQSVWGAPHVQTAPYAEYKLPVHYTETVTEDGKLRMIGRTRFESHTVRPSASEIAVDLKNEFRQKGLLWYSTYKVAFRGDYALHNPDTQQQSMRFYLPLPAAQAVYDDLLFIVDGRTVPPVTEKEAAYAALEVPPNGTAKVRVSYRSQGLESWRYSFGQEVNPVENFHLRMTTNFRDIDFPDNTLAPAEKHETAEGWQLDWTYKNLLSGYAIAMTMPEKLQPGPLASEISFFAPVSLFFFFFLIFIITTLRNVDLHPMNYFFLGAAFFAFHLLLAYLVDHLDIHASFAICSAVSILLVVSYLRLVVGTRFAVREAALAQILYLVLFSYAFFFKGMTGLSITIGAILTLFAVMQMTGRIRWSEKFAAFDLRRPSAAPPFPSTN